MASQPNRSRRSARPGRRESARAVYDPEPISAVLEILSAVGDALQIVQLVGAGMHVARGRKLQRIERHLNRLEDELGEIELAEEMLLDVITNPDTRAQDARLDFGEPLLLPEPLEERYYTAVKKLVEALGRVTRTAILIEKALPRQRATEFVSNPAIDREVGIAREELREILRSGQLLVPHALTRLESVTGQARTLIRAVGNPR